MLFILVVVFQLLWQKSSKLNAVPQGLRVAQYPNCFGATLALMECKPVHWFRCLVTPDLRYLHARLSQVLKGATAFVHSSNTLTRTVRDWVIWVGTNLLLSRGELFTLSGQLLKPENSFWWESFMRIFEHFFHVVWPLPQKPMDIRYSASRRTEKCNVTPSLTSSRRSHRSLLYSAAFDLLGGGSTSYCYEALTIPFNLW